LDCPAIAGGSDREVAANIGDAEMWLKTEKRWIRYQFACTSDVAIAIPKRYRTPNFVTFFRSGKQKLFCENTDIASICTNLQFGFADQYRMQSKPSEQGGKQKQLHHPHARHHGDWNPICH
jgi:hypothetical protein